MTHRYKCIYIAREHCNCYEETFEEFVAFINKYGHVLKKEEIGLKKLAYDIKGETKGRFYIVYYKCDKNFIPEIEKWLRECPYIIKFITMRVEEDN